MGVIPIAVTAATGLTLAWREIGSTDPGDWLPYAILVVLLLATILAVQGARVPEKPVLIGLGGLVGLALLDVVSASWAPQPSLARDEALLTLLYALVVAIPALTLWSRDERLGALAVVTVALGGLAVATGIDLALAPKPDSTFLTGRLDFPVSYVNAEAAMSLIGVWPALLLASRRAINPVLRACAVGGGAAMLAAGLAAQSKGGTIALAISAIAVFAAVPSRLRLIPPSAIVVTAVGLAFDPLTAPYRAVTEAAIRSSIEDVGQALLVSAAASAVAGLVYALIDVRLEIGPRARRASAVGALLLAAGAAAVGIVAAVERVPHPERLLRQKWAAFKFLPAQQATTGTHFSSVGSNRYDFWRVSLQAFEHHPIAGIGSRGFGALYLQKRRQALEAPIRAHSLPIDTLLETGIVGFALLVTGLGALALVLVRRLDDVPAAAAFGAGIYWLVHSSGDWIWTIPPVSVLFFLLLGIGASGGGSGPPMPRRVALTFSAALVLLALFAFVPPWLSSRLTGHAIASATPAAAATDLRWAHRLDPLSVDPFVAQAQLSTSPAGRIAALKRAVKLQPRSAGLQELLGEAQLAAGDRASAVATLELAHELDPLDAGIAADFTKARRSG